MMRFTPMTGVYQKIDEQKVLEGLAQLKGVVDMAIVYFRPWMIEDGTMANVVRCAKTNGIRLISGMRPDLYDQGYGTDTLGRDSAWTQKNWYWVGRLMKAAMKIASTREFFLVMEPAFNEKERPDEKAFAAAMRTAFNTGAHVIMDRPRVRHDHISEDVPWLSLAKANMTKWWTGRTMRLAPGLNYSLVVNPKSDDKQRWEAEDAEREIVGDENWTRRYFVTSNGRWPGDSTQDYMRVNTGNDPMFDFLDAIYHHEEEGDQPPIAYIHIDQFVAVCQQIRKAVTNG